ncbi:MAG: glycosyltransferase family 2 protein [Verrucomicrobiota bacterium]
MIETELPFVSILIPARNEELHIGSCLESLAKSTYPKEKLEIIIADGLSIDNTRNQIALFSDKFPALHVIENTDKNQAAAINLAANLAREESRYLIRIDAHSTYPNHFIQTCIEAAESQNAGLVVYVNKPTPGTPFQSVVATVLSSPLAIGNAAYRIGKSSGFVDHGQHGCFRRNLFDELGGYDPTMSPNEDGELSHRILKYGAPIYLDTRLTMYYVPRNSLRRLFRQYLRWGIARCRNHWKHKHLPKFRQIAPPGLILYEIFALLCLILWGTPIVFIPIGFYFLLIIAISFQISLQLTSFRGLISLLIFPMIHHAWGAGFLLNFLCGGRLIASKISD